MLRHKIKVYTHIDKVQQGISFVHICPLIELLFKKDTLLLEYYELVDRADQSDIIVLPLTLEYLFNKKQKKYVYELLDLAVSLQKKLLVFTGGDVGKTINHPNIITIRLGGDAKKLNEDTYIMSPFIDDPIEKWNLKFKTLPYQSIPSIGFVGHASKGITKRIKEFIICLKGNVFRLIGKNSTDMQKYYPSSIKRYKYLNQLKLIDKIETNFILRKQYRGGNLSKENRDKTTMEFYRNIQDNLYTFCLRGAGNFSVRFYETLAMGRIPLLINTDCRLPFQELINWKEHILFINYDSNKSLQECILEFHTQLDDKVIINMQLANRELWQSHFTKCGYFIKFSDILKTYL